ncbi:MAG: hypothetical protein M3436_20185 [Pseudomonadota bacterium]|nr:hypothetical protein [Pseudomonadota bacterium]
MLLRPWLLIAGTALGASEIGFFLGQGTSERSAVNGTFDRYTLAAPAVGGSLPNAAGVTPEAAVQESTPTEVRGGEVEARLAAAMDAPSEKRRYRDSMNVIADLSLAEIPAALEYANTRGRQLRKDLVMAIITRWVEIEPQAAMEYSLGIREREFGSSPVITAAAEWAAAQPEAAAAWALAHPKGPQRRYVIDGIVTGLAQKDPEAALRFLESNAREAEGSNAYGPIFVKWAERDGAGAAQRALALPPYARNAALTAAVGGWAEREPESAMAFVRKLPDSANKATAILATSPKISEVGCLLCVNEANVDL